MVIDMFMYLLIDIFVKVDCVVMVVSFEMCMLFFDYYVVEFVWCVLVLVCLFEG